MLAEVKKCADAHDIKGLRYIFVDCLDVDPTFEKYREDYEFCCKKIDGLFDPHQTLSGIKEQPGTWTTEYWEQLKLDLMKNFSQIRFEHMIKVARIVYADKISRLLSERSSVQNSAAVSKNVQKADIMPESQPRLQNVSPSAASGTFIDAETLKKLEADRKRLEEDNRRIEAERAAQKKRIAAIQEQANKPKTLNAEENGSKKVVGIVLAIAVVVVIVLIIMALD